MSDLFKQLETAPQGERRALEAVLDAVRYNADGLVPAVAQQHDSGEVLMLAWMNREALLETLRTGRVCYWSRSRGQYWRKGETSGNVQKLVGLYLDCDGDTVLLKVDQTGPACHTRRRSCFFHKVDENGAQVTVSPPE